METCDEPIFPTFEDELQFSQQASHASQPPLPGSASGKEITVGSGRQCSMLLNASDPFTVFSRTLMESSAWTSSEEYCYVWEHLDTRFGCSGFQLTQLEQSIEGTECSLPPELWPTPIAKDAEQGSGKGHHLDPAKDYKAGTRLYEAAVAKLWPTPIQCDSGTGSLSPNFVEWLQGFPKDWTLISGELPKCRIRSQKANGTARHD